MRNTITEDNGSGPDPLLYLTEQDWNRVIEKG